MKIKLKPIIYVIISLFIILSLGINALAFSSVGVCVMDYASGDFYYEKSPDTALTPASLTKIMTLYIIFEKLESGVLTKDTLIPISYNVAMLSRDTEATNIPLNYGENYSVEELLNAITVKSACAACNAMAEYISGSEEEFVKLMNTTAKNIGLSAYFTDSSGLSDYNKITPRSVALLVKTFIKKYPEILEYTSKASVTIRGKTYQNSNKFLDRNNSSYYSLADGFKTGTTTLAGKCLVSTAQKDSTRIISVIMGASTDNLRYSESTYALNLGFDRYNYYNNNIFSTDIRTYINGNEIPCYYFLGENKFLLIKAENLSHYGFNVHYDSTLNTLHMALDKLKLVAPISGDYKDKLNTGTPVSSIYKGTPPKVILHKDDVAYEFQTVFSLNGECCISVDELASYFSYAWDGINRTAKMTTV